MRVPLWFVEPPAWTPRLSEPLPLLVDVLLLLLPEPVFEVLPLVVPATFRPRLPFDAVPEALRLRELAVAFDRLPFRPRAALPADEVLRLFRDDVPEWLPDVEPVTLRLPVLLARLELLRPLRDPEVAWEPEPFRLSAVAPDALWLLLRALREVAFEVLPEVIPVKPSAPWLLEARCVLPVVPPDSRPLP